MCLIVRERLAVPRERPVWSQSMQLGRVLEQRPLGLGHLGPGRCVHR
jgi:hypothetical protein